MTPFRNLIIALIFFSSVGGRGSEISVQEISFQNRDVTLSGSLLGTESPEIQKPAILFVPGSGPGPRSWFLTIAKFYASHGFVALVYDKRGSGESEGRWQSSSLDDLAGDVVAGLDFLKNTPGVDPGRIGMFGVSQGGWVIPVAAGKTGIPSFAIVVSGGGTPPREVETWVNRGELLHGGATETEVGTAMKLLDRYYAYLSSGEGFEPLKLDIEKAKTESWYHLMPLGNILVSPENRKNWQWVAIYDPSQDIEKMTFPVLVLLGDKDFLTPVDLAEKAWRKGFKAAGADQSEVVVFKNAGHGLLKGGHKEMAKGNFTYIDGYFETQIAWLRKIGILD